MPSSSSSDAKEGLESARLFHTLEQSHQISEAARRARDGAGHTAASDLEVMMSQARAQRERQTLNRLQMRVTLAERRVADAESAVERTQGVSMATMVSKRLTLESLYKSR